MRHPPIVELRTRLQEHTSYLDILSEWDVYDELAEQETRSSELMEPPKTLKVYAPDHQRRYPPICRPSPDRPRSL